MSDHSELIRSAVGQGLTVRGELIAGALTDARQAGSIRADLDPATTAKFVLNAWEGTLIEVRATRSADAFDPFFDLVFGVLLTEG
jgi:TetR/AcrR family transcriptional repressor of nem operon